MRVFGKVVKVIREVPNLLSLIKKTISNGGAKEILTNLKYLGTHRMSNRHRKGVVAAAFVII